MTERGYMEQHRRDNFDVRIAEDHGEYWLSVTNSLHSRHQQWSSLPAMNRREMMLVMAAIAEWLAELGE